MLVPAETALQRLLEVGCTEYPNVGVDHQTLASILGTRDLDVRCAADLYLAAAALASDTAALRILDRLLADLAPALRGIVSDHDIDDIVQELRVRLVVGDAGRRPALEAYAGKGPLRAWLRVALVRSGLDRRRKPADVLLDEAAWLAVPGIATDPSLAALRNKAGPAIRAAFEAALGKLDARERLILRQHLLDGLSPPDLAMLHGVHRVTAFRWLAAIKQRVLADVRDALQESLHIDAPTLDSLMRRVRDTAAPSVERLLIAST
jgi:RNA polymerase sigma-70 factor (ECF subfamily)